MKSKTIWVIIIIVILLIGGIFAWQIVSKKSGEGGQCQTDKNCESGLKCIMNICSSGQVGSVCLSKTDCKSGFCVENKCTEGSAGSPCQSKEDCLTHFVLIENAPKVKKAMLVFLIMTVTDFFA
jgi:hypothetical protein